MSIANGRNCLSLLHFLPFVRGNELRYTGIRIRRGWMIPLIVLRINVRDGPENVDDSNNAEGQQEQSTLLVHEKRMKRTARPRHSVLEYARIIEWNGECAMTAKTVCKKEEHSTNKNTMKTSNGARLLPMLRIVAGRTLFGLVLLVVVPVAVLPLVRVVVVVSMSFMFPSVFFLLLSEPLDALVRAHLTEIEIAYNERNTAKQTFAIGAVSGILNRSKVIVQTRTHHQDSPPTQFRTLFS